MKITPLHEKHAIESVSFGVEWTQALSQQDMVTLELVHDGVLNEALPRKQAMQHFEFAFGADGGSVSPVQTGGWTFDRVLPDGRTEQSLVLLPKAMTVTLHVYERWEAALALAAELMAPLVPLIAVNGGGFSECSLQYVNVFRTTGAADEFRADALLRSNSPYLPASVFHCADLWHAHHGYFTRLEGRLPATRKLTTINADLLEQGDQKTRSRLLRILTMHKTTFVPALADIEQLAARGGTPFCAAMDDMHADNATILRKLLADDMLARIGLSKETGAAT